MYTKEDVEKVNISINIAYILAGCLSQACEDMKEGLRNIKSDLRFDNKRAVNQVLDISSNLIKSVDRLESLSILKCDDQTLYNHDCAKDHIYAIIMRALQIIGTDDKSGLRALYVYNMMKNFEDLIKFPKMRVLEDIAFYKIRRDIADGKIPFTEVNTCVKLKPRDNESELETPEGEA